MTLILESVQLVLRGRGGRVAIKYVPKTVERVTTRLESVSYSVVSIASGSETNFCLAIVSQASVCMDVLRDGWGKHAGTNVQITGSARSRGNPSLKQSTSKSNDFLLKIIFVQSFYIFVYLLLKVRLTVN